MLPITMILLTLAVILLVIKKKKSPILKYCVLFSLAAVLILPSMSRANAEEPTDTVTGQNGVTDTKTDGEDEEEDIDVYRVKNDKAPIIDESKKCTFIINYYDDGNKDTPVTRATFVAYKVADIDVYGGYVSLVDGIDFSKAPGNEEQYCTDAAIATVEQNIKPEAIFVTDANGHVEQELPMGLYIIKEIKPAEHHINSKPFMLQLPTIAADEDGNYILNESGEMYWQYEVTAMPKSNPAGDISVKKLVKGNAGEETRDFTFKFTFDALGEYTYVKYNVDGDELDLGENELLASGEEVTLKHNERVVVKNLPAGTKYTITEKEANEDGYVTGYVNNDGNIKRFEEIDCTVTNERNENKTGDIFSPALLYSLIGIAVVSVLVIAFILIKRKSNKSEE